MLSEANNAFACDLYRQLATENSGENLFFSPYSLFSALAMCAEGARGATAQEMGAVLCLPTELLRDRGHRDSTPWSLEPMHTRISRLNTWMKESYQEGDLEIRIANAIWKEKTFPLRGEFVDVLDRNYLTGAVFPVDFKNDADGARLLINRWVDKQTGHRISEIILPNLLEPLTRMVLANAIFFRGTWFEPFDKAETRRQEFTLQDRTPHSVKMMANYVESASYAAFNPDGSFFETPVEIPHKSVIEILAQDTEDPDGPPMYPDSDGFAMVELPYKNDQLSMVIIAPNRHDGLATIEQRLSPEALTGWIKNLHRRDVRVLVPRFKFDTGYQMADTMHALGLSTAFMNPLHGGGADFGGMTVSIDPEDQLYLSEIFHKAFIEVNEEGTEAAAATAVAMALGSVQTLTVPFTPTFKADRPFLCIIRERPTGTILFMGRVMDPG